MKIIDNFLTKKYYREILELLTGETFAWFYSSNVTGDEQNPEINKYMMMGTPQLNEYGFSHSFFHEDLGDSVSPYSSFMKPMLYQMMDTVDCDFILRARADMVTWSGEEDFLHPPHVDFLFPNTACLFYINETDGDTVFYNVKPDDILNYKDLKEHSRVSPKPNRLVSFDGDTLHTGSNPTKHKSRIIINSSYGHHKENR
jgi:hypothetical protein